LGTFLWRSKEKYLACRGDNPAPALNTSMLPHQRAREQRPDFDKLNPNGRECNNGPAFDRLSPNGRRHPASASQAMPLTRLTAFRLR